MPTPDVTSAEGLLSETDQTVVPELPIAGLVTAGKQDEMLNILVNDSFSTNKSGKKKGKKSKKGKGDKAVAKEMGFSALEILQLKETE